MSTLRLVALVSGHVQGVGYRWSVRQAATSAGLAGTATNLPDGRVEVVLEGPADDVRTVLAQVTGPAAPGSVTDVEVVEAPAQGLTGFTTG